MIAGRASAAATAAFAAAQEGFAPDFYGQLGELTVSSLGLGTYLGQGDPETDAGYRAALLAALRGGLNLIDTAINYRAQRSERVIGAVLRELIEAGELTREQVVVASKGGFNPRDFDDPDRGGAALLAGVPKEEVVQGMHCLHPSYIERMLARSLENLGLQALDVYYLHNPETQLPEVSKPIFYQRLRRAFTALEGARERGELSVYGVATWRGLRLEEGDAGALDLQRLVEVARSVAGADHGFRLVQLPVSLAMPEGHQRPGQRVDEELLSAIAAARSLGLSVVTSGPFAQAKLLAEPLSAAAGALGPAEWSPAQRALHFARSCGDMTLVGMSSPEHVGENLRVGALPRASSDELRAALA